MNDCVDSLLHRVASLQHTMQMEHTQAPGLFGEIARVEELLAETYRDRVWYELMQNSDDAGSTSVSLHELDEGLLQWNNDGRSMTAADIESLCRSASSTKVRGEGAIGYRGIGFKSLAAIASYIEVRSADVAFTFDRSRAASLLRELSPSSVPLIRIPAEIRKADWIDGASFTIACRETTTRIAVRVDPTSVLFLRHVKQLEIRTGEHSSLVVVERGENEVTLHLDGSVANFGLLRHGSAEVAIPLTPRALAMTGVRGRLACFLPLDDEIGLPVVVSGHLLTDPSRTHAVVADSSTRQVLVDAATALAGQLSTPGSPFFDRLWQLVLQGEDMRSLLAATHVTSSKILLGALRDEMARHRPNFSYVPVPIETADVAVIFPDGAPGPLYEQQNQATARAAKTVLSLDTLDVATLAESPITSRLSPALRSRLGQHLAQLARTHGRQLSRAEQQLVATTTQLTEPEPTQPPLVRKVEPRATTSITTVLSRWRTAELAVMDYLNGLGWNLHDVSAQNAGYDLEGSAPDGHAVCVEVKKVDQPDGRFAMTNNEMSLMMSTSRTYMVAILVGDGRHARLMILDPSRPDLPRERVCRRWDWEFTDWARFAILVE